MPKKKRKKIKIDFSKSVFILKILFFLALVASLNLIDRYTFDEGITPPNMIYIEALVFCSIFLFVAYQKIKKFESKFNLKNTIIFASIALVLFAGVLSDNTTLNQRLEHGLYMIKNDKMYFDKTSILGTLFGINTAANSYWIWDLELSDEQHIIKNGLYLKQVPEKPKIRWYSTWYNGESGEGNFNNNFRVILDVNGFEHDVTSGYKAIPPGSPRFLEIEVPKEELNEGKNTVMFKVKHYDTDYEIVLIHLQPYGNENYFSRSEDGGQTWKDSGDQAMVFVVGSTEKPNFIQRIFILFESWFIFLGTAFLFISIFGIDMFKKIFKECKKEFFFSIITVFFLLWLFYFYRGQWKLIAIIVAYILNIFLRFFPVNVSMDLSLDCPLIKFGNFSGALCGGCSGVESMAIFTAFFLLIVLLYDGR